MKRSKLKRSNPKRRKRLFAEDFHSKAYVEMIKALPCALCGVVGYSEAAHVKARGAGGKASDIVPLCGVRMGAIGANGWLTTGCHSDFDNHLTIPHERERLITRAAELWAAWNQENTPA